MDIDKDSAQVRVPPPLVLLFCVGFGVILDVFLPSPILEGVARWILSGIFLVGGISIILHCALRFRAAATHIEPWKATSSLLTDGIYRYSRNPIYLSFLIIGLGIAFAVNSLWIVFAILPLTWIIQRTVIAREEAYLQQKFGQAYLDYQNKVRRWI